YRLLWYYTRMKEYPSLQSEPSENNPLLETLGNRISRAVILGTVAVSTLVACIGNDKEPTPTMPATEPTMTESTPEATPTEGIVILPDNLPNDQLPFIEPQYPPETPTAEA